MFALPRRLVFLTLFFQKDRGTVANSYIGVSYILGTRSSIPLVLRMIIQLTITHYNSEPEPGQNPYQYIGKEGKAVLDACWVHECIKTGAPQMSANNFAGCKVTGSKQ